MIVERGVKNHNTNPLLLKEALKNLTLTHYSRVRVFNATFNNNELGLGFLTPLSTIMG
jgi:hypothetical protein